MVIVDAAALYAPDVQPLAPDVVVELTTKLQAALVETTQMCEILLRNTGIESVEVYLRAMRALLVEESSGSDAVNATMLPAVLRAVQSLAAVVHKRHSARDAAIPALIALQNFGDHRQFLHPAEMWTRLVSSALGVHRAVYEWTSKLTKLVLADNPNHQLPEGLRPLFPPHVEGRRKRFAPVLPSSEP